MNINISLQKRLCASMMLAIIGTIGATVPALAQSDAWPVKPVRLIVPFPPGGGGDKLARTLAPKLEELLKTSLVIENKGAVTAISRCSRWRPHRRMATPSA